MDLVRWINHAKDLGYSALSHASQAVGAGVGVVKSTLGTLRLFGSTETSSSYEGSQVDEMHYFLIPDRRGESGYSLYVMRCLPEGVPPLNDLPKRRLFHLPNEHALPTVEHLLLAEARNDAKKNSASSQTFGTRLNDIADQIDQIDGKVFNGVLLIGGLVALINPVAGAAVAAKALFPSIGLLLSKYGLQYVGELADARELASKIKAAESDVLKQFRSTSTTSIVNPLLAQWDLALETSVHEYDPITDFDIDNIEFAVRDRDRLLTLTRQAICNTYADVLENPASWKTAKLGPEDVRYLMMLREFVKITQ